jgi:ribosomal protein RSM22 (predicted rRNA methylase)
MDPRLFDLCQCRGRFYRSGNYYPDTLLICPYKLDCGIPAADGLDNSFRIYKRKMERSKIQFLTMAVNGKNQLLA